MGLFRQSCIITGNISRTGSENIFQMNRQLRSIGGGHVMPTPGNSNNTPQVGFARNNLIFVNVPPSTPQQAGQFAPLRAQRGLNSGYKLQQPDGGCRGLYTKYNLRQTARKSGGGKIQSEYNVRQTTQVARKSGGGKRQGEREKVTTATGCGQKLHKHGNRIGIKEKKKSNVSKTVMTSRKGGTHDTPRDLKNNDDDDDAN